MHISCVRVQNYKSFADSGEVPLKAGITVVTGQNNSGKTALLEALGLNINAHPTRTARTLPSTRSPLNETSSVDIRFALSGAELRGLLINNTFYMPKPTKPVPGFDGQRLDEPSFLEHVFNHQEIEFSFRLRVKGKDKWWDEINTSFCLWPVSNGNAFQFDLHSDGRAVFRGDHNVLNLQDHDLGRKYILPYCEKSVYGFRAERFNFGTWKFGNNKTLNSDASNLAEVLLILQMSRRKFEEFEQFVRTVLPQVESVIIGPHPQNSDQLEISILQHNESLGRDDLKVSLDQCGTGIGHVLAIAYSVISPEEGRTILIDEPSNFLHPGAVRKLLQLLQSCSRHQFIISTNSPLVLTCLPNSRVFIVKQERQESTVALLETSNSDQVREFLTEVGASLSDVFGADRVLWVEGPTEESCFPEIVRHLLGNDIVGTVIRSVKSTGDLTGKHASTILDIYHRLSTSATLLPSAMAFIFDAELRGQAEKDDLTRRKGVQLLPRRMFENYLLCPEGIASLLNRIDTGNTTFVQSQDVAKQIDEYRSCKAYYHPAPLPSETEWQISINGAKVLQDLTAKLTNSRCHFEKKPHGLILTNWLIHNKPEELTEVADLLRSVLK